MEALIGTSVIDYIQCDTVDEQHAVVSKDRSSSEGLQPPSVIPCHESSNILLRGPRQSGRTSLAMNMAHSIASRSMACRGDCGSASCACVAVAILTPLNNDREMFPLGCDLVQSSPQDFHGQLRALQQQQPSGSKTNATTWNKRALRRIQVHRMATIREVMEYLLSIQGKTTNQQPLGGIIVEDLDCFARGGNSSGELSTQHLMTMTQLRKCVMLYRVPYVRYIYPSARFLTRDCYSMLSVVVIVITVALLADTANNLRRIHFSFSVLATLGEGVPWNVNRLWSNWFPISLKIRNCPSTTTRSPLEEDESVESQHILEKVQVSGDGTGKERPAECVAQYMIIRQENGLFRIAWNKGDE